MAPYRDPVSVERLVADVAGGRVELVASPEHLSLTAGDRRLVVTPERIVAIRTGRRRERRREVALLHGAPIVARGWPGRELGLWVEVAPGRVERLWGAAPRSLLEPDGLGAARGLDRLAARLAEGIGAAALPAIELGRGGHRVLVLDRGDRLVAYTRPLFRERPRRAFEVCADGTLVVAGPKGDRRARIRTRFDVVAAGDRICFAGADGHDVAQLFLPWIALEDRIELARRFAERVDPAPPEAVPAPRAASVGGALTSRLAAAWPLPLSPMRR